MMIRGDFSPRITDRLFDDMAGLMLWTRHSVPNGLCRSIPYVPVYASLFFIPAGVKICAAVIKEYASCASPCWRAQLASFYSDG